MRAVRMWGLVLCVLLSTHLPAVAGTACPGNDNALGVSRIAEIDTSAAPKFGHQNGNDHLLADGEVVLTFDDGPVRAYTKAVLEALDAHCTKATFFMVGRMALADPDMVKEVARRGHTIATHTWSHANLQRLAPLRGQAEIELGISAVQQALGAPVAPFFRFPYLRETPATSDHLRNRQIATFAIEVDSRDYRTSSAQVVYDNVLRQLAAARKGIILFHDIHPSSVRALPELLAALKARGYRVVHLQPKQHIATLPEFDEMARQEALRLHVSSAAHPLLRRALTWSAGMQPKTAAEQRASVARPRSPPPHAASGAPYGQDWRDKLWLFP
jgi:peptidoglycan/xylan/chitin deacetylase (PgdA/CDA1 family)